MKYQTYPAYKDSGVEWLGEVPEHWDIKRYKHALSLFQGAAFKSSEYVADSKVVNIRMGNIKKGGFIDLDYNLKFLPNEYKNSYFQYELKEGDLVIAMTDMSPTLDFLAVPAYMTGLDKNKTYLLNQRVGKLIINQSFDSDFLKYLLLSSELRSQLKAQGLGTVQSNMSSDNLYSSFFTAPNKTEQQKIAQFLDHETAKIDTLIEKQQRLIELLKEKRQAVISHAVTKGLNPNAPMKDSGVECIGYISEHWTIKSLSMATTKIAVGLAMSVTDSYEDEGIPIIRNQNIKEGYFDGSDMLYLDKRFSDSQDSKMVTAGDVVIVRTGSNVGQACIVPDEFDKCHTFTTLILRTADNLLNSYFVYCVNSAYGKAEVNRLKFGFGKDNLNVGELKAFYALLPTFEEQLEIVNYIDTQITKIDNVIEKSNSAIEIMQERRTALISAAVTGKIDVRNWGDL